MLAALALLLLGQPAAAFDPKAEIRGRVVDAASGAPLAGVVVVAAWDTELGLNPAHIVGVLIGGHGPGSQTRTSQVKEVMTATDGTFVVPAWSEAERINLGQVRQRPPAVRAFLPGYEPQGLHEKELGLSLPHPPGNEIPLYRYGTKPRFSQVASTYTPTTVENLRAFNQWLDEHVTYAEDPTLQGETAKRRAAVLAQQTSKRMVGGELQRLTGAPPERPLWAPPPATRIERVVPSKAAVQRVIVNPEK